MAIDFPNSPTLNQVFTSGGQSWVWDGTKWNSMSSGFSDAPSDGTTYGRRNATWSSVDALLAPATQAGSGNTGRNFVHNPLFTVAQRGAGGFATNGYTLDRWFLSFSLDTISISQNALNDAQRAQIGDEAATVSLVANVTGNVGANAYSALQQHIEGVRRLAGKTITVSFWAWCGSGALKLGVSLDQSFGTGGSPSASISLNGVAVTLSTTCARYSVTLSVPSASGKTLGTNGDDNTVLDFWFSSGTTQASRAGNIGVQSGAIGIWGVQLEIGSVATPLAKRDPADDLALCQRFYQLIGFEMRAYFSGSDYIIQTVPFPTTMRATPLISFNVSGSSNATGAPYADSGTSANSLLLTQQTAAAGTAYVKGTATLSADL